MSYGRRRDYGGGFRILKSNLSIGNAMSLACSHCFTSFFIKSKPFYPAEKQKEYEYLKQKIKKLCGRNLRLLNLRLYKRCLNTSL